MLYNRNTQFHSTVAFTDSLSGSSKGYTDLEKYKTEAQNLGTIGPSEYLIELASHQNLQTIVPFIPEPQHNGHWDAVEIASNPLAEL